MVDVDPLWWQTLFDDVYLLTDARSVCDAELTAREADFIQEVLEISPGERILDLCGGHGRHSLELARRGFSELTVLDYSAYLLEHGRKAAGQDGLAIDFVQGDARSTCFESSGFDVVMVLGNSFGYFEEPGQDRALLDEAHRLLRPGGRLILDLVDGDYLKRNFKSHSWHEIETGIVVCRERSMQDESIRVREMVLCKKQGLVRDQSYSARLYSGGVIRDLLRETGFDKIDIISGYSSHKEPGDYGFMTNRMMGLGRK